MPLFQIHYVPTDIDRAYIWAKDLDEALAKKTHDGNLITVLNAEQVTREWIQKFSHLYEHLNPSPYNKVEEEE